MVSDSKITMNRQGVADTAYHAPKIYVYKDLLIGTAGCVGDGDKFVKWYRSKRRKPLVLEKDFEALIVTREGLYHTDEDCALIEVLDPWYAIGSGSAAALGALHARVTLEEAVEIACIVDANSGLPIQVAKLDAYK